MCDKPYMFAADSSKKSQNVDIIPDNIKKRRSISVKEKLDILNMVDSGCKLSAVARQFGISSSTASTIVKERHKIKMLSDHYNIDPDRKRMRLGIYRDVDEAVHMWFRQMRSKNIPINGPMLQQKAREFALQLGHQNFEGSSGWLFRFRERHGLTAKTMRDNDDNNSCCTSVGMTDDEIVNSVSQNSVHLNFSEKNISQSEIPENYLFPEIELIDSENASDHNESAKFNDSRTETKYDNNEPAAESSNAIQTTDYKSSASTAEYNCTSTSVYNNESRHIHNNKRPKIKNNTTCVDPCNNRSTADYACRHSFEYHDRTLKLNACGSSLNVHDVVSLAEKLTSFLKEHDVPSNVLKSMYTVSNFIETDLREQMKQRKITDYFKP